LRSNNYESVEKVRRSQSTTRTMSVKIKICGLRTPEALDAALDAGTDFFGLVFYPRSPRNVSHDTARALVERAGGRANSVSLMVDPDDTALGAVHEQVKPDFIQLHGNETPERVRDIKALTGKPVIKAIRIENAEDVEDASAYAGIADFILFDAKAVPGDEKALPGGNGVPFDWKALMGIKGKSDFMLSGGLNPDNVAQAIAMTGARMVDVSSGVESAPGEKDITLIRKFISAARSVE